MKQLIGELPIGPFRIALFETDEPIENGTADAAWYHARFEIVINSRLSGAERWAVLVHELTHAVSDIYDLGIDTEQNCSTLGNGFAQALASFLPAPPKARPPVPQLMDDDKTPSINAVPITHASQMPK